MAWENWVCIGIVVFGIVLFLYGANFYDALIGFIGLYFAVIGLVALLVIYVYGEWSKGKAQKP